MNKIKFKIIGWFLTILLRKYLKKQLIGKGFVSNGMGMNTRIDINSFGKPQGYLTLYYPIAKLEKNGRVIQIQTRITNNPDHFMKS